MALYEFKEDDTFFNIMKTHPLVEFLIYSGNVYYKNREHPAGSFGDNLLGVPNGHVSLYEMNVDRDATTAPLIYPFITKDGTGGSFSTTSTTEFNSSFAYGDVLTGSYPLSASITRYYYNTSTRDRIDALQNVLNYHTRLSPHYAYTSSFGDKETQDINLISIPSIFYGANLQKGNVSLKYYLTGTLIGELRDENKNGELVQIGPSGSTGSGSVAGVVLYDEGFILLTGSWTLNPETLDYISDPTDKQASKWLYFGVGTNDGTTPDLTITSASYIFEFKGTEEIPTLTMLAHAPAGELGFSNNPTFINSSSLINLNDYQTSSVSFISPTLEIKNTVSSSYSDPTGSFNKQVFITKIALYDDDKNLIGIASVARPIRKREEDEYTFKLRLDL
mgnify:FL=1